ncbi:collagen-like protein [Candidatus Pacearchaeota archaeon]|nr:collagen-like protein [Candidatus Pacearchaeota archaeon]
MAISVPQAWQASTAHIVGDFVYFSTGNYFYVCTQIGTSGLTEPTAATSVGETVVDATVLWESYAPSYSFNTDNEADLGAALKRARDLYIAGNLDDGTDQVTVAELAANLIAPTGHQGTHVEGGTDEIDHNAMNGRYGAQAHPADSIDTNAFTGNLLGASNSQEAFNIVDTLGVQGPQGPQGIRGPQGFQGWQGVNGTIGVDGVQGPQGNQGTGGINGVQGPQGWQGKMGPQGYQGDTGAQGNQGWQGVQGVQGSTATILDSTVLLSTGNVSINADPTKVDLPAVTGQYVDAITGIITPISYGPQVGVSVTNIATTEATFFALNSIGSLIQYNTQPTAEELRNTLVFGAASHPNHATVTTVQDLTNVHQQNVAASIHDTSEAIGIVRLTNDVISANGANLKINTTAIDIFGSSINALINAKSPNNRTVASTTAPSMVFVWRNGSGAFNNAVSADFTPGFYDDGTGGAGTPNGVVSSTEFQNFMIYITPRGETIFSLYGQRKFKSLPGALLARDSDKCNVSLVGLPPLTFIGYVTTIGNATALNDLTQANIGEETEIDNFYDNISALGDGSIPDLIDISYVANGTTTAVTLVKSGAGSDDFNCQLDGLSTYTVTSPNNTVNLTHGTDTVPVANYLYITATAGIASLQVSTTEPTVGVVGFYANVIEYLVWSSTRTQSKGFAASQEKFLRFGDENQSHIRHIDKILRENAKIISGAVSTSSVTTNPGSKDNLYTTITAGIIRQEHEHPWPEWTPEGSFDIWLQNDQTTPYTLITDLGAIDTDINGTSLETNNVYYNLTLMWSQDEDGSEAKVYGFKPDGVYTSSAAALLDSNNTAITTVPTDFEGKAVMATRLTIRHETASSGTLTILQEVPITSEGGGGTGTEGPRGFQGWQGNQGWQGPSEAGFQGYQGIGGVQGNQGPFGFQGPVEAGVQGPQGFAGSQGLTGSQGYQGNIGLQGFQGLTGLQGWQGSGGTNGVQGPQGYQGNDGAQGPGGLQWTRISTSQTGSAGNGYMIDGSQGIITPITLTLPATPTEGDEVGIKILANGPQAVVIGRNSSLIEGVAQDLTNLPEDSAFNLVDSGDAAKDWVSVSDMGTPDLYELTDASTISIDFAKSDDFLVVLDGNRTMGNPSNVVAGMTGHIAVYQDDTTGSRTLAWSSDWYLPGGVAPTLSTAVDSEDVFAYWAETTTKIHVVLASKDSQ